MRSEAQDPSREFILSHVEALSTGFGFSILRSKHNKLLCFVLGALLLAPCAEGRAQQPKKIPRVGILVADFASSSKDRIEAFRQGLRDLGYVEGQNIAIDYRFAEGMNNRFPNLAAELVKLKVDILFAFGTAATQAAKNATQTIPIVMANVTDPIATGLVVSLLALAATSLDWPMSSRR